MNELRTERIINRTRYVFVFFFLIAGFSAMQSGSVPAVYLSIFGVTSAYLLMAFVNQAFIMMKKVSTMLIYTSITVEISLIFSVKYAFHFDAHNGYAMSLKEPATFLVYFLLAITCGLRYNKRLNLYYGALAILSYVILILLGVFHGGMFFTNDSTLTFTPKALRISHELPKLLFLGAFIYFISLMADFTNKNFKKIDGARTEAHRNLNFIHELLSTVKLTASDLFSQSKELKSSTDDIHITIGENNRLIDDISRISRDFAQAIASLRDEIGLQNSKIEQNFSKITQISELMEDIHKDSISKKEIAANALNLAESNERHILESVQSIKDMRDKSRKIDEISNTINDIADKTNLLSLNAAIESARAGEYGRGFAVVSDEISKLAGVSSESSKEITTIIRDTVKNIEEVYHTVEDMSKGLNRIIEFVKSDSEFVQNLNKKTEKEFEASRQLYSSNVELDTLTKGLLEHFNNQRTLIERIIGWLDRMAGTSGHVSQTLGTLAELSRRLEDRSVAMNEILKTVNV